MIKIRVDWHQECPNCQTELVVDLLSPGAAPVDCPWCGANVPGPLDDGHESLRMELLDAAGKLEAEFTGKLNKLSAAK